MSFTTPRSDQAGTSVLVALFRHNAWASLNLLDFCARLSDEQQNATTAGTYGSIRDTLVHLIEGEISYVERINGKLPENPPPWDPFPGFEVLSHAVRWTGDEMLKLALSAHADTLVTESFPEGPSNTNSPTSWFRRSPIPQNTDSGVDHNHATWHGAA